MKPTHIAALAVALAALLAIGAFTARAADPAPAAAAKPALTVTLTQPQRSDMPLSISANGSIAAWQEASVGAEAQGLRLQELRAAIGDTVRAGQVLPPPRNSGVPRRVLSALRRGLSTDPAERYATMDALLSDIKQAGLGRSLQFDLFRPGQIAVRDYYAELPITLRVTGKYHDIGSFASDIANLSRIVTLNNLAISPRPDGSLTMDATAKTFRYLDSQEVAAQRKAVGGKK